jgi:hypothetical protein
MWDLWQQVMTWCWSTVIWVASGGHWTIIVLVLGLVLLYIVFRKHRA